MNTTQTFKMKTKNRAMAMKIVEIKEIKGQTIVHGTFKLHVFMLIFSIVEIYFAF